MGIFNFILAYPLLIILMGLFLFFAGWWVFDRLFEKGVKKNVIRVALVVVLAAATAFFLISLTSLWSHEREIVLDVMENTDDADTDLIPTTSFQIHGKILIWETGSNSDDLSFFPSDLNSKIPELLRAESSSQTVTVFLVKNIDDLWGHYDDGARGHRICKSVVVFYYPSKNVVSRFGICGSLPPWTKLGAGDRTGSEPDSNKIIKFIYDAIIKMGEPAVEPLIEALKDKDSDATVRENAARALGEIKDARALEPLLQALKDKDARVRGNAVWALGEIKDARAIEPLIRALMDEDSDDPGYVKDTGAWKSILEAPDDVDLGVRWKAAQALGNIGDSRAVEPLISVLKDKDVRVRESAARALGEIKDARAIEPLIKADKDNVDVRWDVRWAVDSALKKICGFTLSEICRKSDR